MVAAGDDPDVGDVTVPIVNVFAGPTSPCGPWMPCGPDVAHSTVAAGGAVDVIVADVGDVTTTSAGVASVIMISVTGSPRGRP